MRQWDKIKQKGDKIVYRLENPRRGFGFLNFITNIFNKIIDLLLWVFIAVTISAVIGFLTFMLVLFK